MVYHTCPCCSSSLLRHFRSGKIYWFCCDCHQEMPALDHEPLTTHRLQNLLQPTLKQRSDLATVPAAYFMKLSDTLVTSTSR
ncbi:MAG: hypothetical protein OT478_07810 [Cyanobacteria bacterium FC1]|nr:MULTISPECIES: hypothetical protein [unclassified Desertifilum]MDA0210077.1 hypothetical protein [Cyanobacteria bacterium FC1]